MPSQSSTKGNELSIASYFRSASLRQASDSSFNKSPLPSRNTQDKGATASLGHIAKGFLAHNWLAKRARLVEASNVNHR